MSKNNNTKKISEKWQDEDLRLEDVSLEDVQLIGLSLKYAKNQTPELCLAAVQQNPWALKYVKKQTPEVCIAAVKQEAIVLDFVRDKTAEICLAAYEKSPRLLILLSDIKLCYEIIKEDYNLFKFLKNEVAVEVLSFFNSEQVAEIKKNNIDLFSENFELMSIYEKKLLEKSLNTSAEKDQYSFGKTKKF